MADDGYPSLEALKALSTTMGRDRWHGASDVAQVVASFLRCHPRVEAVRYAGLKSDPLFQAASTSLECGFGPQVSYMVAGEWRQVVCEVEDPKDAVMSLEHALGRMGV